jgi:hypothetical protein
MQHHTSSSVFLKELGFLHALTGDQRFEDVIAAIAEYELIDLEGNWRRDPATALLPPPELENFRDIIFVRILSLTRKGSSLRMACAQVVVEMRISGHSFEAACKEIERLYRSYIAKDENPSEVAVRIMSRTERNWPDMLPAGYIAWRQSRTQTKSDDQERY